MRSPVVALLTPVLLLCGLASPQRNPPGHTFGIAGDQFTLDRKSFQIISVYVAAPWLRKGSNEVVVFALEAHRLRLRGLRQPISNQVASE